MDTIIKIGAAAATVFTLVKFIITFISYSRLSRFERIFITDYKKIQITLTEGIVITSAFSFILTLLFAIQNEGTPLIQLIALFVFIFVLLSTFIWTLIKIMLLFVKKKYRYYYLDADNNKLYIHKLISDSEIIVSHESNFKFDSDNFKVIKRESIYDKNIKKELI